MAIKNPDKLKNKNEIKKAEEKPAIEMQKAQSFLQPSDIDSKPKVVSKASDTQAKMANINIQIQMLQRQRKKIQKKN